MAWRIWFASWLEKVLALILRILQDILTKLKPSAGYFILLKYALIHVLEMWLSSRVLR